MLIRSQDRKSLFNLDNMCCIVERETDGKHVVGLSSDATDAVFEFVVEAGTYSTEAKAMKVMDEIESMYIQEAKHTTSCVFYMPQDDEVKKETKDAG